MKLIKLSACFLTLLVVTLLAYSNSFHCDWHFDDFRCIVDYDYSSATMLSLFKFSPARFIGFLTFWLSYKIGQYNVFGWHVFNFSIHFANVLLVFFISQLILARRQHQKTIIVSMLVAALFAVHPIQTQAVTYIVQRLEILGTHWLLLTFYFGLRAIKNKRWWPLALVAFCLGLMTKEIIVAAPLLIGLYYLIFECKTLRRQRQIIFATIGLTLLGIMAVLFYCKAIVFAPWPQITLAPFARLWQDQPPPSQYYPTQARVLLSYLRLCFLPFGQHVEYYIKPSMSFLDYKVLLAIFIQLALLIWTSLKVKKYPFMIFGLLWFYFVLGPSSTLLPNGFYEHRLYCPLIGILFAVNFTIFENINKAKKLYYIITILIILLFTYLSFNRNISWKDGLSLWQEAAETSPNSWRANGNYGKQLMDREDYSNALVYIEKGLILRENSIESLINIAVCNFYLGQYQPAIEAFEKALKNGTKDQKINQLLKSYLVVVYYEQAKIFIENNQHDSATKNIKRIFELDPNNINAKALQQQIKNEK